MTKKNIIIITSITIVLIGLIGGYFVYTNYFQSNKTNIQTNNSSSKFDPNSIENLTLEKNLAKSSQDSKIKGNGTNPKFDTPQIDPKNPLTQLQPLPSSSSDSQSTQVSNISSSNFSPQDAEENGPADETIDNSASKPTEESVKAIFNGKPAEFIPIKTISKSQNLYNLANFNPKKSTTLPIISVEGIFPSVDSTHIFIDIEGVKTYLGEGIREIFDVTLDTPERPLPFKLLIVDDQTGSPRFVLSDFDFKNAFRDRKSVV